MSATYRHAPGPTRPPISFRLDAGRLVVDTGRKVQTVELGAVEQVRMTYEPGRFAQKSFRTKLRLTDGTSLSFSSLNWKSMVEAERLDREYRLFATALLQAIARANPQTRFVAGRPRSLWIGIVAAGAVALLAMVVFTWRALRGDAPAAALLGGLVAVVGIWQIEPMVRLNRPRAFTPDAPPRELMP